VERRAAALLRACLLSSTTPSTTPSPAVPPAASPASRRRPSPATNPCRHRRPHLVQGVRDPGSTATAWGGAARRPHTHSGGAKVPWTLRQRRRRAVMPRGSQAGIVRSRVHCLDGEHGEAQAWGRWDAGLILLNFCYIKMHCHCPRQREEDKETCLA